MRCAQRRQKLLYVLESGAFLQLVEHSTDLIGAVQYSRAQCELSYLGRGQQCQ